jgi:predicted acylesterase/phospholipase RssA
VRDSPTPTGLEPSLQERAAQAAAPSRRQEGIALCLSGGGYRAALFHLGVLRRLHELKLFPEIRAVSSVSGGSIMAAFLANALLEGGSTLAQGFVDWQRQVSDPLHRLTARDIRTWPFLLNLPWNWLFPTPRVRYLERLYRRDLSRRRLDELPVEFILCATDLVFGASWEFAGDRTGDWRAGYVKDAGQWPLARAVAASSAFPPIFGPVRLNVPGGRMAGRRLSGTGSRSAPPPHGFERRRGVRQHGAGAGLEGLCDSAGVGWRSSVRVHGGRESDSPAAPLHRGGDIPDPRVAAAGAVFGLGRSAVCRHLYVAHERGSGIERG